MPQGAGFSARASASAGGPAGSPGRRTRCSLLLGGPGTGKTARLLALAEEARAAGGEPIVLAVSPAAASVLRSRAAPGTRVLTLPALALLVLREIGEGGAPRLVGRSERLAMLHEFAQGRDLAAGAPTPADHLERMDRLAAWGIDAQRIGAWASALADGPFAARQRAFAALVARHDQLLRSRGLDSSPGAVLTAGALLETGSLGWRCALIAVDDGQQLRPAELGLVTRCARAAGASLVVAADDDQAPTGGDAASAAIRALLQQAPDAEVEHLERSARLSREVARAGEIVVASAAGRLPRPPLETREGGAVAVRRTESAHELASRTAAEVAGRVAGGVRPDRIAVACVDPARDARALALALEARGVRSDAVDAGSDAGRPELRDLLAWIRLLLDPSDAPAVVRALSRPPVGLPSADVARVVRVARRRRCSLVQAAREAAGEPGMQPRSRERALELVTTVERLAAGLDGGDATGLLRDVIGALGLQRRQLIGAGPDARAALRALRRVEVAASGHVARTPDASPREVLAAVAALLEAGALPEGPGEPGGAAPAVRIVGVRIDELRALDVDELHLIGLDAAAVDALDRQPAEPLLGEQPSGDLGRARRLLYVAMTRARERVAIGFCGEPSPIVDEVVRGLSITVDAEPVDVAEQEQLLEAAGALRDQLSLDIARAAAGLGDLRLDGDVDVGQAVARVLELIKVAALLGRDPQASDLPTAISAVNHQLAAGTSALQQELLAASDLDERLREGRSVARDPAPEPSVAAFLPRRGEGIALSATDIATYLACPLQYKFGRVLKVPRPQTVQQRFGIAVHQAIERFHGAGGGPLPRLLALLDAAWRSGGLGGDEESVVFRGRAEQALRDYHARLQLGQSEVSWVERPFDFRIGRHALRGRVDRVDRLPDGGYELIDIKTGPPRERADLERDVQLALYDLAARDAWRIEPTLRSYYYVLDDAKVQLPAGVDAAWVSDTVAEVGGGIEAERFEPTPSPKACGWCDFRLACPAAER